VKIHCGLNEQFDDKVGFEARSDNLWYTTSHSGLCRMHYYLSYTVWVEIREFLLHKSSLVCDVVV
jgi:hypothetical protein